MKSTDEKNRDDAPAMHKPVAANSRDMGAGKEKMKQNRKKLGVEEDHKTKDMEKSRPGPFPDAKCY